MISTDEALELVLTSVSRLGAERISIREAAGRVLAEDIVSARDIPPWDNTAMDGYAVRAADIAGASPGSPIRLRVNQTIAAGSMPDLEVSAGHAARIMTGAPMPRGADAIVPVEQTRGIGETVEIIAAFERGAFIRLRGEDLRAGDRVIECGKRLSAADLGMLASLNRSMLDAIRRPRVAIVATGDELVDVDQIPRNAQIVNSSGYALAAAVSDAGGEPTLLKIARDSVAEIRERISQALHFDLVLTTGGVSVGQFDHVKAVLDELGLRQLFHGVAQKPGRPLKFGLIGEVPVFGLPGNPVSTLVCFYLYALPAIRKMGGRADLGLPRIQVRCGTEIRLSRNLTEFVRVRIERRNGELYALPTGAQGSGILSSVSRADGLLIGPVAEESLKSGAQATVLVLLSESWADASPGFEDLRRFHRN